MTEETGGFDILGFVDQFPWVLIPLGTIMLWIGINTLWNGTLRPKRAAQGVATASFNNILGRVFRFIFKEDKYPILKKDATGQPTNQPKYEKFSKLIVWRNLYLLGLALPVLLAVIQNSAAPWILGATLLIIATRVSKVFAARHQVLIRMFEVAASEMGYPREANLNPWGWVQITEWDQLMIPGETHVVFPNKYKAEEKRNRDNFERHFNGTVTDDNTWLYTWKSSKSMVTCSPVTHIPEYAQYKGSAQGEWDKIPLGLGAQGEVFWDVSKNPMSLITGTTGGGKNNSLRVLVETTEGQKTIGDLKVGDMVFDPEGNPAKVAHLHPIVTPAKAYELTFSNGETIIADPDHLWETETREARLIRFDNVNKEHKRSRSYWLSQEAREAVESAYEASANDDTISIPEVGELTGKHPTTGIFYSIAKEIGVAEEVRPKIKLYHKARVMKQMQSLLFVNSKQFMEVYNNRRIVTSKAKPLTRNHHDKLRQLLTEVREGDTLTVDSMVEYLGGDAFTARWVRQNFQPKLGTTASIQDLYEKGESAKSLFPDKIFSIDAEYLNARDFSALVDVEFDDARRLFLTLANKCEDKFKKSVKADLVRPERVTVQEGTPYFTYPKRMFLERILRHDDMPLNDQRHKRLTPEIRTTQEIYDTLKTTGATVYTNHSIRRAKALQMPEAKLPIHPYAMGAWLGDGASPNRHICGIDSQVFENIVSIGYEAKESTLLKIHEGHHPNSMNVLFPTLAKQLRKANLQRKDGENNVTHGSLKSIPSAYFSSSIEQRRELLRGLLDTDGSVQDNGSVQFYTSVPQLRDDVKRLVAGLGYIPFVSEKQPTAYTITFQADPADRLFGLDRKNAVHAEWYNPADAHSTSELHYIVDIREVAPEPMRCISVDSPSRLFVIGESNIPTHNSTIQRNIIFHCIQHPDRWRFLGIDVKRVELSVFAKYEPVVMGIATDVSDGVEIIRYAKEEMEKRYQHMQDNGVNHFKDLPEKMHALMVMVDETYMFLAPSGIKTDEGKAEDALKGEASKLIGDIARLGRAAGVHLVLATQRPDATVIYGELKQNLACRVAAGRADTIASQMTLDNEEATRLPGHIKGRGYVQNFGEGEQFQGYFAPPEWIDRYLRGDSEWLQYWAKTGKVPGDGEISQESGSGHKKRGFFSGLLEKMKPADSVDDEMGRDDDPVDEPRRTKGKKSKFMAKIEAYNARAAEKGSEGESSGSDDSVGKAAMNELTNPLDSESSHENEVLPFDEFMGTVDNVNNEASRAARELELLNGTAYSSSHDGENEDDNTDPFAVGPEPDLFASGADDSFSFPMGDFDFNVPSGAGSSREPEVDPFVGLGMEIEEKMDTEEDLDPFADLTPPPLLESEQKQDKPVFDSKGLERGDGIGASNEHTKTPQVAPRPAVAAPKPVPRPPAPSLGAAPQRPASLPPRPTRPKL